MGDHQTHTLLVKCDQNNKIKNCTQKTFRTWTVSSGFHTCNCSTVLGPPSTHILSIHKNIAISMANQVLSIMILQVLLQKEKKNMHYYYYYNNTSLLKKKKSTNNYFYTNGSKKKLLTLISFQTCMAFLHFSTYSNFKFKISHKTCEK